MKIDELAFLTACMEIEADRVPPSQDASKWFRRLVEAYEAAKQPNKHSEKMEPAEIGSCIVCGGETRTYRKNSGEWVEHECPSQNRGGE